MLSAEEYVIPPGRLWDTVNFKLYGFMDGSEDVLKLHIPLSFHGSLLDAIVRI
jgi:hypothetical protein